MIWIMAIALFAAASVGFWEAEKAKKKRKNAESRIGKRLEQQLDFGSFEMEIDPVNHEYTMNTVNLSDRLSFSLSDVNGRILVHHHAKEIGCVPAIYGKYSLLLQAMKDKKRVVAKCIKSEKASNPADSTFAVSFEVKH